LIIPPELYRAIFACDDLATSALDEVIGPGRFLSYKTASFHELPESI